MAKVSTICSIVLLTHYMGFTKALDKLNILVPYDAAWSETWLEATLDTYRDAGTDTPLEYSTMWINQANVFMLALQHFSLDGNWTAILDLTSDCYLWEEPGSSTPLYIALAFCSTDIPSISPSTLHFLQAAIDILQSQKINLDHLALILDDNQEIIQEETASILNGSALTMIPIHNDSLIDMVLRRLVKESASLATIVIGTSEQNKYVLHTACSLKTLMASVYWVVITTDWVQPTCPPCQLDSIVYIRLPWVWLNTSLYDTLPREVRDNLTKRQVYELWDSLSTVIDVWKATQNGSILHGQIQTKTASGQVVYDGVNISHRVQLDVLEVSCNRNETNSSLIGKWLDGKLDWYSDSHMGETRPYRLRVATFHEPPFVIKNEAPNGSMTYEGYAIDVLREIMKLSGEEYDIYEAEDKTYGTLLPNGEWNGLIGELVHGTADIAIGPISVTAERESVVDFTTPYYDFAGIQIVMKKTTNTPNMFAFSDVFDKDVWICWAVVLCTTAILIFIFERYSPFSTRNSATDSVHGTVYNFKECWWFVITSFTMSGSEGTPRPISTRVLVAGFWFFCSIMMSTYTANLAAHLTLSRLTDPVESLDDLAAQSEIKYSAMEGSTVQTYFRRMAEIEKNFYSLWKDMSYGDIPSSSLKGKNFAVWDYPLGDKYQNIWKQMENNGFLNSSRQGMEKVKTEKFAFFHDSPMIKFEMSSTCNLEVIGGQFSTKPYAFALRENSAHTKKISSRILELQQERKLDDLKERWWNTTNRNCPTNDENDGLTFQTVAGIFIVMAAGTVFSILVLIVELSVNRFAQRRKNDSVKDVKRQDSFPEHLSKCEGSSSTLSSRL